MADRQFFELRSRGENSLDSGLTELNAATSVDKGFMSHNDWVAHVARYGYAAKVIAREKVATILDYGCGSLQLPYYLWRNRTPPVEDYWGVDLRAQPGWLDAVGWNSPMALVRADLVLDDLDEVPGFPGEFDLVVCTEVLEHVPVACQEELIARLFSHTRPGGVCLFSTPNAGISDTTAENHLGPDGRSRERSYADKLAMVQSVGFELEAAYGTFCGSRRVEPLLFGGLLPTDCPAGEVLRAAKELLPHGWWTVVIAAAFPAQSNNALFKLRRPVV